MQTLAFGLTCQDEDIIVCVGRKIHIETSVLWRQRVSIQALLQMEKYQILTHPFSRGFDCQDWGLGFGLGLWAQAVAGQQLPLVEELLCELGLMSAPGGRWTCSGRCESDASSQFFRAESMWAAASPLFPKTDINTMQATHRSMQKSTSQVGLFSC